MRTYIVWCLAAAVVAVALVAVPAEAAVVSGAALAVGKVSTVSTTLPVLAQNQPQPAQPQKDVKVDINVTRHEWYANPVWVAIGAIAFVVLILLIVMAVRGGGTSHTVIKD